ncbi:hypothetical protein HNQ07_001485 [Deinococcus metalli]|uniref:Uncharacterized protein n=1 Tax=Deinococcus metalli TaxID=1141878 RepID=A0A7W8KF94_9DEIO|nr:hypothetical protein [Deinococcus metalli]MBB5376028.1 hypothetical protein [Deinococcus metalli]GHF41359.1 hypothetical protein GCM10017781_17550 [Deinococcus metalli]
MQLLTHAQPFEYRSHSGADRLGSLDVWTDDGRTRAVVVLRDVPVQDTPRALRMLSEHWLPYLLPVHLEVMVLAVRADGDGGKARARVLPLSA